MAPAMGGSVQASGPFAALRAGSWRWSSRPVGGKLALFVRLASQPRPPGLVPCGPTGNWLCFARSPLVRRAPSHPAPPGIGFVLHIFPSRSPGVSAGRAELALFGAIAPMGRVGLAPPIPPGRRKLGLFGTLGPPRPAGDSRELGSFCTIRRSRRACLAQDWVCFARLASPRARPGGELALFRTIGPTARLPLFRDCPGDGWHRQGRRSWRWSSPPADGKLGSFRAIAIGVKWWNDRIVGAAGRRLGGPAATCSSTCLFLLHSNHKSQFINHKSEGFRLGPECLSTLGPYCTNRAGILRKRDAAESRNSLCPKE
jgi:hypothetical protein